MLYRDLPEDTRTSFLKAYLDSYRWPWMLDQHPEIRNAKVQDKKAYRKGEELRGALEAVFSADLADYREDCDRYDEVVRMLNAQYGADFALFSNAKGGLGLRGLRIEPFSTVTETVRAEDGMVTRSTTDLAARTARLDAADRNTEDDQESV